MNWRNWVLRVLLWCFLMPLAPVEACTATTFFSPYDNIEDVIVQTLWSAEHTIHASLFGISNERIADVLAHRAAEIEVLLALDKRQSALKSDKHEQLEKAGATVTIKPVYALEHNKFVVIDGETVLMGSWNWSGSAQKQDNSNILFLECPDIAAEFEAAFQRIVERDR